MPSSRRKSRGSAGSTRTCELLEVSKSAYYQCPQGRPLRPPAPMPSWPWPSPRSTGALTAPTGHPGCTPSSPTGASPAGGAGWPGSCAWPAWRAAVSAAGAPPPSPKAAEQRALDLVKRHFGPSAGTRHPLCRRHHLHLDLVRLRLPGHGHRPGQPPGRGLGTG